MMKKFFVYSLALFYIVAGTNHFFSPEFYLEMMPDYLPFHELLNVTSGLSEITLGLLVLYERMRKLACYGLILLLLAIYPANINMLLEALDGKDFGVPIWALYVRLPFQFLFIYWAWAVRDFKLSEST
ncbi:motility protein [Leptospira levettii]|uniref:DoxX family membrane protein n=2 Tax=Leptospira levettii TaxID=2023178 RepID=A0ABY2ML29_9LEPT|nr:motility protein [Leptospira levettii]PJZ87737.1 motility protein [Leptospira levettii]PJZ99256.1 motility protein [Leptospira levettii]TGL13418.1 DoxX family membrane protein [Leptospira levettii]TGL68485.1 DoxX family membrane protein [Leptospira levettii]